MIAVRETSRTLSNIDEILESESYDRGVKDIATVSVSGRGNIIALTMMVERNM